MNKRKSMTVTLFIIKNKKWITTICLTQCQITAGSAIEDEQRVSRLATVDKPKEWGFGDEADLWPEKMQEAVAFVVGTASGTHIVQWLTSLSEPGALWPNFVAGCWVMGPFCSSFRFHVEARVLTLGADGHDIIIIYFVRLAMFQSTTEVVINWQSCVCEVLSTNEATTEIRT